MSPPPAGQVVDVVLQAMLPDISNTSSRLTGAGVVAFVAVKVRVHCDVGFVPPGQSSCVTLLPFSFPKALTTLSCTGLPLVKFPLKKISTVSAQGYFSGFRSPGTGE